MRSGDDANPFLMLLLQLKPDGSRRFSDEDIRHFLPLVFFGFPVPKEEPVIVKMMTDFFTRLGLTASSTRADAEAMIEAFYDAHPPDPVLLREFRSLCRARIGGGRVGRELYAVALAFAEPSPADA